MSWYSAACSSWSLAVMVMPWPPVSMAPFGRFWEALMMARRMVSSDSPMRAMRPGETCTRTARRSAPLMNTRATPGSCDSLGDSTLSA